jgi:hypothetical protein
MHGGKGIIFLDRLGRQRKKLHPEKKHGKAEYQYI